VSTIRLFYVGFSTLFTTIAAALTALIGARQVLTSGWLSWLIAVPVSAAVLMGVLRFFICFFGMSSTPSESFRFWLSGAWKHQRKVCLTLLRYYPLALVVLFLAVGVFSLSRQVDMGLKVIKNTEAAVAERTAEAQARAERLEAQVRSLGAALKDVTSQKAVLEEKMKAVASENIKLRETVKKASAAGVLPRNFALPPQ